jgi:hypothetical protein
LFGQHSSFSVEKPFCRANIGVFPWKMYIVGPTLQPFRGKWPLLAQHCAFSMEKALCWPNIGLSPWKDGVVGPFFGQFFGKKVDQELCWARFLSPAKRVEYTGLERGKTKSGLD